MRTLKNNRRYVRVPLDKPAELSVRVGRERKNLAVRVEEISCEGAGLILRDTVTIQNRSQITMGLAVGDKMLHLPGTVAYTRGNRIGIRLRLELALPDVRQRYATWIVDLTTRYQQRASQR